MKISPGAANEIARLMRNPGSMRADAERIRSRRHGHYDPNQPRVPAGHADGGQWTDADAESTGANSNRDTSGTKNEQPQLVQFPANRPPVSRNPAAAALMSLLAALWARNSPERPSPPPDNYSPQRPGDLPEDPLSLYAALSARNTRDRRAVFRFNARQYLADPDGELRRAQVAVLNRDEVKNACEALDTVQARTDEAKDTVWKNRGWFLSRSQFGTAVHKELEKLIKTNHPNLGAEVSRVKSEDANQRFGVKDSVRFDVLECAKQNTACIYDIKTGESRSSGLSPARMLELAEHAVKACSETRRVVVTEVRPSR